jgi:acetoacetyl-CoA synthetase
VKQVPISTTVELLTTIWQRVLQHSPIDPDDNFFDLGGDSSLALQLFNEIARVSGRELPPVMIYHASTIAALAALLDEPTTPRFPPLVMVKDGVEDPPVFITHGLGGSVIDFFQVVRHLQTSHPIYGMQARGIDGVDAPFDRIEDIAEFYLDAVKRLQPCGPYLLIGYSLGGLVTLEMAQRLTANREKVALLVMLDTYPHMRHLSLGQQALLATQQVLRRASGNLKWGLNLSASYQPPSDVPLSPALLRFRDTAYLALQRYRPKFYSGEIKFVRAEIPTYFPADPVAVWGRLAHKVVVDTIAGDHLGIITTYYEQLAAVLSRYLRQA